jgi:hypothetical protein
MQLQSRSSVSSNHHFNHAAAQRLNISSVHSEEVMAALAFSISPVLFPFVFPLLPCLGMQMIVARRWSVGAAAAAKNCIFSISPALRSTAASERERRAK